MRASSFVVVAVLCAATPLGCGSAWTARACASNPDGNCRATDTLQGHSYSLKSPVGVMDVNVAEPHCTSGIGAVAVTVQDRDDLQMTLYCLVDQPVGKPALPTGTMTLTPAPASSAADGGR